MHRSPPSSCAPDRRPECPLVFDGEPPFRGVRAVDVVDRAAAFPVSPDQVGQLELAEVVGDALADVRRESADVGSPRPDSLECPPAPAQHTAEVPAGTVKSRLAGRRREPAAPPRTNETPADYLVRFRMIALSEVARMSAHGAGTRCEPSLTGQSVTLRGWGPLDASLFAAVLAEATRSGATTVMLDLTNVDYFGMEAAAALVNHVGHSAGRPRPDPGPSAALGPDSGGHRLRSHLLGTAPGEDRNGRRTCSSKYFAARWGSPPPARAAGSSRCSSTASVRSRARTSTLRRHRRTRSPKRRQCLAPNTRHRVAVAGSPMKTTETIVRAGYPRPGSCPRRRPAPDTHWRG